MSDATSIVEELAGAHKGVFDWIGIFWVDGPVLKLGPYVGHTPVGHETITIPEGVCGAVAASGVTEVVPDVNRRPGHIACELTTRSETVAPIVKDGVVIGVLDIDSNTLDAFDEALVKAIEGAAARIGAL